MGALLDDGGCQMRGTDAIGVAHLHDLAAFGPFCHVLTAQYQGAEVKVWGVAESLKFEEPFHFQYELLYLDAHWHHGSEMHGPGAYLPTASLEIFLHFDKKIHEKVGFSRERDGWVDFGLLGRPAHPVGFLQLARIE
jgi:hypothetical protein